MVKMFDETWWNIADEVLVSFESTLKLFWRLIMLSPFIMIPLTIYMIIEILLFIQMKDLLIIRLIKELYAKCVEGEQNG